MGGVTSVEPFAVQPTEIAGLLILTMKQITDQRGTVREAFRTSAFAEAGVPTGPWAQVNITETKQGVIRGLHGEDTIKLVAVAAGEAYGAYVDARPDSPTRGKVVTVRLLPGTQVLVPAGVCNGFQSVSPGDTQYVYCFTNEWVPGMAGVGVNPLDPALAIQWPLPVDVSDPAQLSAKDAAQPNLAGLPESG